MTEADRLERPPLSARRIFVLAAAALVAIFAVGMTFGMVSAAAEHEGPHSAVFYLALIAAILVAGGALWLIVRNRAALRLPTSRRMRKSAVILYACLITGFCAGVAFALVQGSDGIGLRMLFTDQPTISSSGALILLAALAVTLALSVRWHMLLDEHERAAYDFGAVAAIYLYFILSAGWWALAIGGLAPPPNGYVIFWFVSASWLFVWLFRRFR